jgi:acetylornithine deacetylase/succinyl-diaminopimelate desuccinylase-like protein
MMTHARALLAFAALGILPAALSAQASDAAALRTKVREYRTNHDVEILRELSDFLAIPNLATDSVNIRRNARELAAMLERRGVKTQLLESPGSPPAVFGELRAPSATRTLVFYAHYDGQPVDTTQWATKPWAPTLRDKPLADGGAMIPLPATPGTARGEWRLYARSAGDDKSPIVAMLAALDALKAAGSRPSVNLKFFLEGEEEAGSPHLREMLTRHADLLRADAWLFCDGPVHQSRAQQILYGVRGVMGAELTVYGPKRALHSGHYGNWAPNPIVLLANLVASMRDEDGRIKIAGYYDDVTPITPADRRALATVPAMDSALRAELLLGASESHNAPIAERIMVPALNLRGFSGGAVGALAANAIPVEARASIDFRLVPRQTTDRVRSLVEAHARARGFHVVHAEPTPAERMAHAKIVRIDWDSGYPASRTALEAPAAQAITRAVDLAVGKAVIRLPMLGGSLPLHLFDEVLRTPYVVLPIVNHDNSQHAANENLRLQNLWDGVELFAGVLAHLGGVWPQTLP